MSLIHVRCAYDNNNDDNHVNAKKFKHLGDGALVATLEGKCTSEEETNEEGRKTAFKQASSIGVEVVTMSKIISVDEKFSFVLLNEHEEQ